MHCPRCHEPTRVLESRSADDGHSVRRRRSCTSCAHRFTTFERREPEPLFITKRDGSRERFDRAKLCSALERAAHKRSVDRAALGAIADETEAMIAASGGELSSDSIASHCLDRLQRLDRGAYLQYAGTLPEPNAQFAPSEPVAGQSLSVRAEGNYG
jgi:transcriptional repressor NrdR